MEVSQRDSSLCCTCFTPRLEKGSSNVSVVFGLFFVAFCGVLAKPAISTIIYSAVFNKPHPNNIPASAVRLWVPQLHTTRYNSQSFLATMLFLL